MTQSQEPIHKSSGIIIPAHLSESFTSRRKVIITLGLATTALCATSERASASWFGKKTEELPIVKLKSVPGRARIGKESTPSQKIGGFPHQWERQQGRNLKDYANYLNSLKMRNISAQQVIEAHAKQRGSVWNTLPPRKWWARMGYTLRVVDRISSEMQVPVKEVVSAYRSAAYNARCRGARRKSWHQANVAIDVRFATAARNVTRAARNLRDGGLFEGGIGSYSSFTHIDTRGKNANW